MSMPGRIYCTYFDQAYEPRARLMVTSLREVGDTAPVTVVCFDEVSRQRALTWNVDGVTVLSLVDLETRFPFLPALRAQRSRAEYMFTCTPWVTELARTSLAEGGWATYLDSDLAFAAAPEPIYRELGDSSAGIVPHRFSVRQSALLQFGTYNVGWVSFRNDPRGRALLGWWGDRCREWCADKPLDGRFADQGYLDSFNSVVDGVHVIEHPGANVAPWNLESHRITHAPDGTVIVDGSPLLFFHMHGIRRVKRGYVCQLSLYNITANSVVRDAILTPYIARLAAAEAGLPRARPARRGDAQSLRAVVARWRAHLASRKPRPGDLTWPSSLRPDDTSTFPTP